MAQSLMFRPFIILSKKAAYVHLRRLASRCLVRLVADHKSPWELYDLAKDRSETHNLAAANPEKVNELEAAWNARAAEFYAMALQDPQAPTLKKGKGANKDVE